MMEVLIGSGAGLLGALIGAWAALRARVAVKARVEVVDLAVLYPDAHAHSGDEEEDATRQRLAEVMEMPGRVPVALDIKLRNSGGQSAYITELSLEVSDPLYAQAAPLEVAGGLPESMGASTATYHLRLPSAGLQDCLDALPHIRRELGLQ
ncbi:hypothetical protein [Streptomyces sp. NPDC047525]|uniref:hypothetical protein n=1 Tax=Streptomyces sp. NPDC047525 TaxID=3155264 RepID=UPI0033D9D838